MSKVFVFNFVTLNGFFKGPSEDISWHRHGAEENEYAEKMLGAGGTLLFGRVTYQMMASYWPTPEAIKSDPAVAKGMNKAKKVVFSRTLEKADWNNTRVVNADLEGEIKRIKRAGKDLTVLGSGTIVDQLAQAGLVDEYQIMIDPVALASGTTIFAGIQRNLDLKLKKAKVFESGIVLLRYRPKKSG